MIYDKFSGLVGGEIRLAANAGIGGALLCQIGLHKLIETHPGRAGGASVQIGALAIAEPAAQLIQGIAHDGHGLQRWQIGTLKQLAIIGFKTAGPGVFEIGWIAKCHRGLWAQGAFQGAGPGLGNRKNNQTLFKENHHFGAAVLF